MKMLFPRRLAGTAAAVLLALSVSGCGNRSGESPETVAGRFLDAYLQSDYGLAATYCCEPAASLLSESVSELEKLRPEVREAMSVLGRETRRTIDRVTGQGRDSLRIGYTLYPDSLTRIPGELLLVREHGEDADATWKVLSW